jgi:glycosyltransferase involved in cell wall biosynthesis
LRRDCFIVGRPAQAGIPMKTLRASVIIPTFERRAALERALRGFAVQTAPADSFELIVALDGGRDDSGEMLARAETPFPLRVARPERKGRAAARNAALALAAGTTTILLDDDMEPSRELVAKHLSHHEDGTALCVLGAVPVRLEHSSPLAARHVRDRFADHMAALAKPGHRFVPRDFYSGNVSIPTALLREVGGFDDGFAPYGNEDVELAVRLGKAGTEMRFDQGALAWQEYDKSLRGFAADTVDKGRTSVLLARRHPDAFAALRLARPDDGSRPWLAARSLLLALARLAPASVPLAATLAVGLERLGLWRSRLFYRTLLDYCFWAGADGALREDDDDSDLGRLSADLHRGPIDLLLHG